MTTAYRGKARFARAAAAAAAVVSVCGSPLVHAGKGAGAKGQVRKLPAPEKVWVQLYAAKGMTEPLRNSLEEAITSGANDASDTEFVRDEPVVPDDSEKELASGDEALARAKKLIQDLDFEGAGEDLSTAIAAYSSYLSELMVRDGNASKLIDASIQMVIVQFLNGDEEEASRALSRAFVLDPELEYDRKRFPPQLEEFIVQELLLFDELGRGTLQVSVTGGPAIVLINGIERGEAPVEVEDLPAGPTFVKLNIPGGGSVSLTARVEGEGTFELEHKLELPPSQVRGPLAKARSHVGKGRVTSRLRKAGKKLKAKVDGLLLVVPKMKQSSVQLVAYLYDLRSGKMVSRAATEVDIKGGEAEASDLGQSVVGGAVWVAGEPRKPKGPPFWKRKFWKHKYFWPAVGVAAGVVVVGTVAAAAATSGGLSPGQKVGLFPVISF